MKINTNKWIAIIVSCGVMFSLIWIYKNEIHKTYIQLFHKSAIIAHYNRKGELDGEYIAYINGRVYGKSYFKDGLREGWCIWYDDETWKKKNEVFYKRGKADGIENVYYKNGNLNYTTHWKNGRYCKSEYHYLDNGTLNTYNAFDESKNVDNDYCYIAYDGEGNFHQILGDVFSPFIYSMCKDSIVALNDKTKFKYANDLYVSVATPPQLIPIVDIFINKANFNRIIIKENAMIVPNIFKNVGSYQITIYGKLLDKNGRIIKADTLKSTVIRE